MNPLILLLLTAFSGFGITAERTIILYNSSSSESIKIARFYQKKRNIPVEHLLGLPLSTKGSISVAEYESTLENPLKTHLDQHQLWTRDKEGRMTSSHFDLIVTIYGVPYKTESAATSTERTQDTDRASIDAELATLGLKPQKKTGYFANPFFKKTTSFQATKKGLLLVGRIDGPSTDTCKRMILDAIETEQTGLQGFCYLDKAFKGGGYKMGDTWLDQIKNINQKSGIPTILENTSDVFLTNYPMTDVAFYYGWYSHHYSGPFRNENLTLKKGSIVTHIHSYSASDLRNPKHRWSGPILQKGATATLGNVHEPFLRLTTHLDHFHQQLLSGKTLVESAWSATPALSWQNIILGDPLYRPFQSKQELPNHIFKHLTTLSPLNTKTKFKTLLKEVKKAPSPLLHEAIGLIYTTLKAHEKCLYHFRQAQKLSTTEAEKVRNIHHQIAYHRSQNHPQKALTILKANLLDYRETPSGLSLVAMKNILAPPPPPPTFRQIK